MKKAFTLVEVLAVIVLLTLLLSAAVPYFAWVRDVAANNNAINRAVLLNAAKGQYLLEKGYKAHTIFNNKTDAAKYADVLVNYLGYVSATLGGYVPEGYTYGIGKLSEKVGVTKASSSARVSY
jgi:prepilin-type N-terminal cleavage/methylation domain-containing protein